MLHTGDDQRDSRWVRCRARTWQVLDCRVTAGGSTTWRLARANDTARIFVSPPDVVDALPARTSRVSRHAWMHACASILVSHQPVWWPAGARALPIDPLPYQYVPAMAFLSGHHRRLLLADDVGMGKTVQAAILLHEVHAREPDAATLVVVPAALVPQWTEELRRRAGLDPSVLDADAFARETACRPAAVDASRNGGCWVVSIDLVRQPEVAALLMRTCWTLTVVDEAHLAAPGTARLAAVSALAAVSVRTLLLTATPYAAGPPGAAALRAVGGRAGEPPMRVVRRAEPPTRRASRRTHVLNVALDAGHHAVCRDLDEYVEHARHDAVEGGLLPALVLRRRASSCPAALVRSLERRLLVLGSAPAPRAMRLPGLLDDVHPADIDAQDDEVMRVRAWRDGQAERELLERVLAAARTLSPGGRKLDAVARLVGRCREPAVVFTAFVDTLRALRRLLPVHVRVVVLHGAQPDPLRRQAVDAFTSGDADVLVATDAAAEGLNLHERCRLVVHAEVPVSARNFLQRTGRVDRYGQSRRVHAVVMSSDTREDMNAHLRLARGCDAAQAWAARAARFPCRRTRLADRRAARTLARTEPDHTGTDRVSDASAPAIACSRLSPPRWHRLASRLDLHPGTDTLVLAALSISGGPALSSSSEAVLLAGGSVRAPVPATTPEVLPRMGARRVRRAAWLAARIGRWEQEARQARDAAVHAAQRGPDLFQGAARGAAVDADVDMAAPRARWEVRAVLRRAR